MVRPALARPLVAALLAASAPGAARAAAPEPPAADFPPAERLLRARVCWRVPDLTCAAAELAAADARATELDPAGRAALLELRAEVALAAGDPAAAAVALDTLVAADPAYAPSTEASPALVDALAAARRRADREPPRVAVRLPPSAPSGRPLALEAEVSDASEVARVVARVALPDGAVVDLGLRREADGRWRGAVPAELVRAPELRLFIEAWDVYGQGPGRAGAPDAPLGVAVTAAVAATPVTETWWFWTAVGAGAVAGGVVLAVLLGGSGGDGGAGGETGGIQVVPAFP